LQAFAISTQGVVVDGTNGGVMFLTSDTPEAIAAEILPYLQSINRNVIKASKIIPATETI
jgi:hypothetical protein